MEIKEKVKKESRWKQPDPRCLKINCDVAVDSDGTISMGFVVRNASGGVSLAGKQEMRALGDSTLLEGYAMRYSIQMAKQYNLVIKSVECDSKNLVEAINGRQKPKGYLDIIISDIVGLARDIGCMSFDYILRQFNCTAHQAAQGIDKQKSYSITFISNLRV